MYISKYWALANDLRKEIFKMHPMHHIHLKSGNGYFLCDPFHFFVYFKVSVITVYKRGNQQLYSTGMYPQYLVILCKGKYVYIYTYVCIYMHMLSRFSHVRLCHPMDYSPQGSSVHGISQARILKWVAISLSRGSSRPRDHKELYL